MDVLLLPLTGRSPSGLQWTTSLAAVGIPMLLAFLLWIRRHLTRGVKLPPGPLCLPFIGSPCAVGRSFDGGTLMKLADQYGPYLWLRIGLMNVLVISSPEAAKDILVTEGSATGDRFRTLEHDALTEQGKDFGFADQGPHRKKLHKLAKAMFLPKKLEQARQGRKEELKKVIKSVRQEGLANTGLLTSLRGILKSAFRNLSLDLLISKHCIDNDCQLAKVLDEEGRLRFKIGWANYIPVLRPFWELTTKTAIEQHLAKRKEMMRLLVQERQDIVTTGCATDHAGDLLDFLLQKDDNTTWTEQEIGHVFIDLQMGGEEFSTVEWALAELVNNQGCQDRLREELCHKAQQKDVSILYDADLEDLPYLSAVIHEVLRLHPPAPYLMPRTNRKAVPLKGGKYVIPQNTYIMVDNGAMSRDPSLWGETATKFCPERFLDSKPEGRNFRYLPFGYGPRVCTGAQFALGNVKTIVAVLVQSFKWSSADRSNLIDMKGTYGLVRYLEKPLRVRVEPVA